MALNHHCLYSCSATTTCIDTQPPLPVQTLNHVCTPLTLRCIASPSLHCTRAALYCTRTAHALALHCIASPSLHSLTRTALALHCTVPVTLRSDDDEWFDLVTLHRPGLSAQPVNTASRSHMRFCCCCVATTLRVWHAISRQ